jgi:parallel beta-helix repeat protein
VLFLYSGGAMSIQSSTFTGNHSVNSGGAIKFYDVGPTSVTASTFSGNSSSRGGAIKFYKSGVTTVTDSTISGNSASFNGGGMFFYKQAANSTISGSTISGNTSTSHGGGIFFYKGAGTTTISNSTISGNSVTNGGGGGIVLYVQTLVIDNSTVTGNSAPLGGNQGGIYLNDNAANVLTLNSTIVANSSGQGGSTQDLSFAQGVFNATSSLVKNATGITFAVNAANIFGQDPLLGPLANNGGPTFTHALGAGSPAIDTGANPLALSFDQRGAGFARTFGAATDIGAFEVQSAGPPPVAQVPVPTLSQWGVGLLSALMAGWAMLTGFGRRRRG